MSNIINFLVESGTSLALLSLIYVLFLRKETFFMLNRIFLLFSVAFSVILPFIKLRVYDPEPVMLSEITVAPYQNLLEMVTVYGHGFSGTVAQAVNASWFIIFIYAAGVLLFTGRFVFRLIQVYMLIRRNPVTEEHHTRFVFLNQDVSPFSFFNYIFISPEHQKDPGYDKMIAHEMEHIKQGHTWDVLILEMLTVLQWFNPFMWLLSRTIRENHEYLADRAVLDSGVNSAQYKRLLLNQVVGAQLIIANNFNSSLIKKRIKMISKIKSSKLANLKYIMGFIPLLALVIAFACEQEDRSEISSIKEATGQETKSEQVLYVVDQMPVFPGGEMELRKLISSNVKYPFEASKNNIQGKVYITFTITKEGKVADAKVVRGVDPALDNEALRVINMLPDWTPGYHHGEPVNVSFTVPINFKLE